MPRDLDSEARPVRAWDLPTRLFHWTLVLLIISAYLSFRYAEVFSDHALRWHRWNGYAILVLLVFRVIWGFAGSSTSLFTAFLQWPWVAARYALDLVAGRNRHFLGHNPLGSWMIVALLGAVATQAGLGLFTVEHNDAPDAYGPLYRIVAETTWQTLSKWHRWIFYWILLPLIGLHITANILYGVVKKDPLISAMVTGVKPAAAYEDMAEARIVERPLLRALLCLAAAAAIVFGGIVLVGGRL